MTSSPDSVREEQSSEPVQPKRLYRSSTQRVVGGVCGGLGEYFAVDPVWFRIGFIVLAIGGGSGVLAYVVMWLALEPTPDGHVPSSAKPATLGGTAIVGLVLMMVGAIALVERVAPWMDEYIWPAVLLLGGLALAIGGLNRDDRG